MDDGVAGPYRVGVDIGGTFTDLVIVGTDGRVATRKISSTPDDYRQAILDGMTALLRELALDPATVREVLHGTTVATNAILEHRGAPTGLITTRGFRDTLEIGRLRYPRLYDLTWSKPPPLVERRWRVEVAERLDRLGQVVEPLDNEAARAAIRFLLAEGVTSLAVSLLHSYANPGHEQRLAEIAAELAPGLPLSLSSEILPEIGEYERTSTTVVNAYIRPVVGRYLSRLDEGLAGIGVTAPVLVMQSSGGVMSARAAADRPIQIVESGPAAGVIAAQRLAQWLDLPNVITLDMGGTTAKASIVEDGRLLHAAEYEVGSGLNLGNRLNRGAGYVLRVPAIDIAEVGAGGGSVVWVDAAGGVHVGPRSAGAVPGPVCYGLGGGEPTLTDANLILGYLNPAALLGGALPIDRESATAVFAARVARPLGMDLRDAALGAHQIAVASMVRAVKAVSSERGRDPRGFALLAFGGNGPVHAARVAAELGLRRIVVPPWPGLFSAFGLLVADLTHHFSRTILRSTRTLTAAELERCFHDLEAEARQALAREGDLSQTLGRSHARSDDVVLERAVDLRYVGQSFELRIPVAAGPLGENAIGDLEERFGAEHERTYGHRAEADPIEIVNARVTATARRAEAGVPDHARTVARAEPAVSIRRPAYFGPRIGEVEVPVLGRRQVGSAPLPGPLVVEEYDATTVVPPGCTVRRDDRDNLVIDLLFR